MLRRDATQDERRDFVRLTWERKMTPPHAKESPWRKLELGTMIKAGACWMVPRMWAQARRSLVGELLRSSTVEVIEVEGTAMGWIAWEHDGPRVLVHFAYVVPGARRAGLGRMLLAPLVEQGHCEFTHMTDAGAQLLAACTRKPWQTAV